MSSKQIDLDKNEPQKKGTLRILFKITLSVCFLKLVYFLNPLGLPSSSAFYSKTLFYQWTTDLYKGNDNNPVSVVIVRDESIQGDWPVKAIVHADILEAIAERNPKAVFVDFAFLDRRGDETFKNDLIPIINDSYDEIDLYFLALAPAKGGCDLRISENKNIQKEIDSIKEDYKSKKYQCAVLLIRSDKVEKSWTIAGYNDDGAFINTRMTQGDQLLKKKLKERKQNFIAIENALNKTLNVNEISCILQRKLVSSDKQKKDKIKQAKDQCPALLLFSEHNPDQWEVIKLNNDQTPNKINDQDKKLSLSLIKAYQIQNRIIAT